MIPPTQVRISSRIRSPRRNFQPRAWALVALMVILASDIVTAGVSPASPAKPLQRVLVLYSDEPLLPAITTLYEAFRATFAAHTSNQVNFYTEFLAPTQFPGAVQEQRQRDFLRDKWERPPQLVIAVSRPALAFAMKHRAELFPGVPIIHCSVAGEPSPPELPDATVAHLPVFDGASPTLELALQLHPDTRLVAVVSGSSPRDEQFAADFRSRLASFEQRVAFQWLTNRSLPKLRDELSRLPEHSVVLYLTLFQDATGQTLNPRLALAEIAPASRSPIYGCYDIYLGNGVVGGSMVTFAEIGRKAARLTLRILAGEDPQTAVRAEAHSPAPRFDWRQLRRWNISEKRLPPGTVVLFRPPTLWQEHPGLIVATGAVVLAQALTIGALVAARRRRRQASAETAVLQSQLAHASRVSLLGQLSSSLAHELNQPLGAILRNAEAGELFLRQSPANLAELSEILRDIRKDDERASLVISHLRNLLRPQEFKTEALGLPALIEEVLAMTKAEAAARQIAPELALESALPAVPGDKIQIQQVLLNLMLNAMDAVESNPAFQRRVVLRARRADPGFVEVSVVDSGPGFAPAAAAQLFHPFFTTKARGMGLGLSISQSIIHAHGGRIWAENNAGGGATFFFTLKAAVTPPV